MYDLANTTLLAAHIHDRYKTGAANRHVPYPLGALGEHVIFANPKASKRIA